MIQKQKVKDLGIQWLWEQPNNPWMMKIWISSSPWICQLLVCEGITQSRGWRAEYTNRQWSDHNDNRTLTYNLCSKPRPASLFSLSLPTQGQPEKARSAPETNHIRYPTASCPTLSFSMPTMSNQKLPRALAFLFFFVYGIKFNHSPDYLWISDKDKWWWLKQ